MAELSVFATSILTKVTTFAVEYAINDIKLACNVRSELEKLKNSLGAICAVLKDAERKQCTTSSVKHWLENLKDFVYDIDDVLDDVGTRALQQKVGKGEIRTYLAQLFIFPFELARNIRKVRERLNEIAALRRNFDLKEEPIDTPSDRIVQRETYSIVDERKIVGRDKAKIDIVKVISEAAESKSDTLSVLPLIGMGGVGKTALAKLVFNDKRTKEKFDKTLWACVSNVSDLNHIVDVIIQSDSGESNKQLTLEALQKKLQELLGDKRYLLVLDDISNDNISVWEELMNLLPCAKSGSMILITTRLSKIASVLKTIGPYEVPKLPHDECMKVFARYAFKGEKAKDTALLKIGESIVQKCDGLPLAARTLGSLLFMEDISKWQERTSDNVLGGNGSVEYSWWK
ncbi:putative disease resistance protein RGA3 [Oryza brachyantha]|uniref:putative disease resistance protein RGA3 n=1 Tax=Oryza brachyantha TaxID=4533 RepID=UPI001ADA4EFB|nr:putative disease resistance protein RGA3 [Oryza brachyantha]